jgi:predicted DNA-binding protein
MKSIKVIPKKKRGRGRPATGRDPVTAVRLPDELRGAVDQWALEKGMSRSEAIRSLIERGLKK